MNTKEQEKATTRPWKWVRKMTNRGLGPRCIIRVGEHEGIGAPTIATINGSKEDMELIVKAVNEYDALNAIANDMTDILVAEFGSLKNARHLAQSQVGIGYWAQIVHNYDQWQAIRSKGK